MGFGGGVIKYKFDDDEYERAEYEVRGAMS